jgi:hypothetical protein
MSEVKDTTRSVTGFTREFLETAVNLWVAEDVGRLVAETFTPYAVMIGPYDPENQRILDPNEDQRIELVFMLIPLTRALDQLGGRLPGSYHRKRRQRIRMAMQLLLERLGWPRGLQNRFGEPWGAITKLAMYLYQYLEDAKAGRKGMFAKLPQGEIDVLLMGAVSGADMQLEVAFKRAVKAAFGLMVEKKKEAGLVANGNWTVIAEHRKWWTETTGVFSKESTPFQRERRREEISGESSSVSSKRSRDDGSDEGASAKKGRKVAGRRGRAGRARRVAEWAAPFSASRPACGVDVVRFTMWKKHKDSVWAWAVEVCSHPFERLSMEEPGMWPAIILEAMEDVVDSPDVVDELMAVMRRARGEEEGHSKEEIEHWFYGAVRLVFLSALAAYRIGPSFRSAFAVPAAVTEFMELSRRYHERRGTTMVPSSGSSTPFGGFGGPADEQDESDMDMARGPAAAGGGTDGPATGSAGGGALGDTFAAAGGPPGYQCMNAEDIRQELVQIEMEMGDRDGDLGGFTSPVGFEADETAGPAERPLSPLSFLEPTVSPGLAAMLGYPPGLGRHQEDQMEVVESAQGRVERLAGRGKELGRMEAQREAQRQQQQYGSVQPQYNTPVRSSGEESRKISPSTAEAINERVAAGVPALPAMVTPPAGMQGYGTEEMKSGGEDAMTDEGSQGAALSAEEHDGGVYIYAPIGVRASFVAGEPTARYRPVMVREGEFIATMDQGGGTRRVEEDELRPREEAFAGMRLADRGHPRYYGRATPTTTPGRQRPTSDDDARVP